MKLSDHILRKPLYVAFGQAMAGGGITSVDLVATRDATTVTMTASDGSAAPITGADASTAGVLTAADKIKLDSLPAAVMLDFAVRSEVTAAVIDAGITHLRTAGYAALGDGGEALYQRAGDEPVHNLKIQSSDNAWWEIVPSNNILSFQSCGGIEGDDAANGAANVTAFDDFIGYAQAYFTAAFRAGGPTLQFNKGDYHFNDHLNVKAQVKIVGAGSAGQGVIAGTRLRFAANQNGIIVHMNTTIDDITESSTWAGSPSLIESLYFQGNGPGDTTGIGIWLRGAGMVRDCYVYQFGEDGVRIESSVGSGGSFEGNANQWRLEGVTCKQNGRHGLFVQRADSNAGYAIGLDCSLNARWGINDSSFLGNTYLACHVSGNGVHNVGGNPATETSWVNYGGNLYSANKDTTEALLVATTPGTDETVWLFQSAGSGSGSLLWLASQSEGTYFIGGPITTDDVANRSIFLGCYRESNQGANQVDGPAMMIGGFITNNKGTGYTHIGQPSADSITGRITFDNAGTWPETNTAPSSLLVNNALDEPLAVNSDDGGKYAILKWSTSTDMFVIEHNGLGARRPVQFTSTTSTETAGRSSALAAGEVFFPKGIFVGPSVDNARHMTNSATVPSSGEHARGEIVWKRTPTAAGHVIGWMCITAGTPGTWVEIRGLGNQTSGAGQAALTNSSGGTGDGTIAAMPAGGIGTAAGGWDTAANRDAAITAINDNFTELHTLLDEVRDTLVTFGLMKGGA